MALYRPDTDGNFNSDENNLIERWISGADGRFTEEDRYQDRIPEGFGVGRFKTPPDQQNTRRPVLYCGRGGSRIYGKTGTNEGRDWKNTAGIIRMVNLPLKGRLELVKKADDTGKCWRMPDF